MSNYNVGDIIFCNPSKNLRDGLFHNIDNKNIKVVVVEVKNPKDYLLTSDYCIRLLKPDSNILRNYGGGLRIWWVNKDCLSPCKITNVSQLDIEA